MFSKETYVVNDLGIHARPASNLVAQAKQFQAKIQVENLDRPGSKAANAKSIMQVLTLAAKKGNQVRVTTQDSDDAQQALDSIIALIDSGLGE